MRIRRWRYFDETYQDYIEASFSNEVGSGIVPESVLWTVAIYRDKKLVTKHEFWNEDSAMKFWDNYQPPWIKPILLP